MCATKLHRAKIDGPAVAGLSFFAIRWRAKLHPEAIIKDQRQPQAACTPGGLRVDT